MHIYLKKKSYNIPHLEKMLHINRKIISERKRDNKQGNFCVCKK